MTTEQIAAWAREAGMHVFGSRIVVGDGGSSGEATESVTRFAALVAAHERERCAGGNDLEAMCEAFHRLIEAYADRSPFHQPICSDAQMALRVLRGVVSALSA